MSDDWRLRIEFEQESGARELTERLEAFELMHDLKTSFHDRVIVSRDGPVVFAYTDTREQAEAAARVVEQLRAEHGWPLHQRTERWHPAAERWEDVSQPVPQTMTDLRHEHAELVEAEREESQAQGYPLFEVRVSCPTQEEARGLAERLRAEGLPTAQRWRFVVVGAADEDTARALADRVKAEAPAASTVTVGASIQEVAHDAPLATPFSPFAVFGALAN